MLQIKHVKKEYRTGTLVQKALDDVTVSFRRKEFVAILGPSGSGKTTLLNMIGGLDRYDSGEMVVEGTATSHFGDRDWDTYRNHTIGFIFQSYNLIPHQTILSNVELALTLTGVGPEERRKRAEEALERVGLLEQKQKKPSQLSGEQMQRVAIARALVNEPSVLLADEPTGALDSETGVQVMDLLKEVAKDRLVIMVTHNPDLAERYATRIVHLRDGKITKDTDPYEEEIEESQERKKNQKKPSMSFLTAFLLSVSNLLSKKARTALVAFAASIGIVGIALILSLSNGANDYIERTQRDSLSQYPIDIAASSFSMEQTMLAMASLRNETGEAEEGQVTERQMMGGLLAGTQVNDLSSLKRYLDSGFSGMEEYARGVDYTYGISPQIYQLRGDGYAQVNPDQTMAAFGLSMDDSLTEAMAGYRANEVFLSLPENESLYKDDYTLLAGNWPEKDTDLVLVLTGSGGIPDFLLYTMGFKDMDTLSTNISDVIRGSNVDTSLEESVIYDPDDFLGVSFRLLPAYDTFVYDEKLGLWTSQAGDKEWMLEKIQEAEEMKIVGVVKPAQGVNYGILQFGIEYPAGLLTRLSRQAKESTIVKAQEAEPDVNILTGIPFGESAEDDISLLDMVSLHPENIPDAVSINWDGLQNLENEETRLTTKRLVKILRELSRTGESQTLKDMVQALLPALTEIVNIDEEKMRDVISYEMDEQHMQEMYAARAASLSASFSGNMTKFGYADPDEPLRVTIYPVDFESKAEVIRLLDAYNATMEEEGYEEKVISYTDYVGALMSSVTTIIDVITYVLIAFVAVSLVVSSIMIGIITYISVLERRKEIGILRAMGASKMGITEVFNAETFIIGLLAGTFGILSSLLLQIPINAIIRQVAERDDVKAFLPPGAGFKLILLCIFLTFLGGFIPSRQAARQDPVTALRSE